MNRFLAYALEALEAIWRNRTRSILTMVGMIIGTASVIAVLGIGNAASGGIAASLDSFGDPGVFVSVNPKQDDPASAQIQYRDAAIPPEAALPIPRTAITEAVPMIMPTIVRIERVRLRQIASSASSA